jgi:hypothetical protein
VTITPASIQQRHRKSLRKGTELEEPLTQPPYSPDLTASDFYVFGHLTHCLKGQSFETAHNLFSVIEVYRQSPLNELSRLNAETPEIDCNQWSRPGIALKKDNGNYFYSVDGETPDLSGSLRNSDEQSNQLNALSLSIS